MAKNSAGQAALLGLGAAAVAYALATGLQPPPPVPPPSSGYGLLNPDILVPSPPIHITSDAQIAALGGVLQNLSIAPPAGTRGVWIENTTAPIKVVNVRATTQGADAFCVGHYLGNSLSAFQAATPTGSSNVTFQNCLALGSGYGFAFREGSTNGAVAYCDAQLPLNATGAKYAYMAGRFTSGIRFDYNHSLGGTTGINLGDWQFGAAGLPYDASNLNTTGNLIEGATVSGIVYSSLQGGLSTGDVLRFGGVPRLVGGNAGAPRAFSWEDGAANCRAVGTVIDSANALGIMYQGSSPVVGLQNSLTRTTRINVAQSVVLGSGIEPDFVLS